MRKGDKIRIPRSIEHRKKLSLAMLGNKNHSAPHAKKARGRISEGMIGNTNTLGKKYGRETRLRDRLAKLGAKNPAWQGGVSFDPYSSGFNCKLKREILERDGYRCQICGEINDLHIHHINYDKHDCGEKNLIVLCHSCHSKTNHNRDEWRVFNGQFQRMGRDDYQCDYIVSSRV